MFTVKYECEKNGSSLMIEASTVETFEVSPEEGGGIKVIVGGPNGQLNTFMPVTQPDPNKVDHTICDKVWVMNRSGATVAKYIL